MNLRQVERYRMIDLGSRRRSEFVEELPMNRGAGSQPAACHVVIRQQGVDFAGKHAQESPPLLQFQVVTLPGRKFARDVARTRPPRKTTGFICECFENRFIQSPSV